MYLERSMEFRDDLICNQKMTEIAKEKLQGVDSVTCWPFTHGARVHTARFRRLPDL